MDPLTSSTGPFSFSGYDWNLANKEYPVHKPDSSKPQAADPRRCMFCSATEETIPLISLRYQGGEAFVCPRCLPRLVHPER